MATAGRAVMFSGLTVAVGLLALMVVPVGFLRSVGVAAMLIPLVSIAVAVTLLPVILATIGPRLDWPRIRREDHASRGWLGWGRLVTRHRFPAAGLGIAVLVALLVAASGIHFGRSANQEHPPARSIRADRAPSRPQQSDRRRPPLDPRAYFILRDDVDYHELGGDYFARRSDPERQARRLTAQLERLGHKVTLEALPQPA